MFLEEYEGLWSCCMWKMWDFVCFSCFLWVSGKSSEPLCKLCPVMCLLFSLQHSATQAGPVPCLLLCLRVGRQSVCVYTVCALKCVSVSQHLHKSHSGAPLDVWLTHQKAGYPIKMRAYPPTAGKQACAHTHTHPHTHPHTHTHTHTPWRNPYCVSGRHGHTFVLSEKEAGWHTEGDSDC